MTRIGFDMSVRRKPLARAPREPLWVLNGGLGVRLAILGRSFTGRATEGPVRSMGRDGSGLLVWAQEDAFLQCSGTRRLHVPMHTEQVPNWTCRDELSMALTWGCSSRRTCLAVNRSTTRIVPPQGGHCCGAVSPVVGVALDFSGAWLPAERSRAGAISAGAGWPTTRSSESAEEPSARHAARSGAGTPRG